MHELPSSIDLSELDPPEDPELTDPEDSEPEFMHYTFAVLPNLDTVTHAADDIVEYLQDGWQIEETISTPAFVMIFFSRDKEPEE